VRNNFMNKRVTVNSKELLLGESNGHASVAYNSIGKHLARIRLNTTSSEASLPTLLYKALDALKKHDLALAYIVNVRFRIRKVMQLIRKLLLLLLLSSW